MSYGVGNPGPGLRQAHTYIEVKPVNWTPTPSRSLDLQQHYGKKKPAQIRFVIYDFILHIDQITTNKLQSNIASCIEF